MAEIGLTKNQIVSELVRSTHGDLKSYVNIGKAATKENPEFMAHLIAWNRYKGQVRDSKTALPIVALLEKDLDPEFVDNALAHITVLGPRELLKAYHFALDNPIPGRMSLLRRVITAKLLEMEKNWPKWERTMLLHRSVLRDLFALLHISPADVRTDACLFGRKNKKKLAYPPGGLFELVSQLKTMTPLEAAGTILAAKIPFMVAAGAMGPKLKDPDVLLALIKNMSATELVTNTKNLEKWGMKTNSALRGAFAEAIAKAGTSTANVLKATTAAEAIEDEDLKADLQKLQEAQIAKVKKDSGLDGNWLVLADKSGSMAASISIGRELAGTLAKMVKGQVWLTFFDTMPRTAEVTGMTFEDIKLKTKHVKADGGTSIGCGLMWMIDNKVDLDGIAIVSDGGDNTGVGFHEAYKLYSNKFDKQIPVYFYQVPGDPDALTGNMKRSGFDLQVFDLRDKVMDAYSIPNLVQTMRTSRYSLIDEIMETRLMKLPDAIKNFRKEEKSHV